MALEELANVAQESESITTALLREGRGLEVLTPVFYWVGLIAVVILVVSLLVGLIGPLFENRPYYPFYYGRNLRSRRAVRDNELLRLAVNSVLPAIEKEQ